jgi:hypothetical protein
MTTSTLKNTRGALQQKEIPYRYGLHRLRSPWQHIDVFSARQNLRATTSLPGSANNRSFDLGQEPCILCALS